MTRDITILAFAVTLAGVLLLGRRAGSKVPPAEELLGHVMSSRTGRVITLLFWIWIGWHFFAR
ncbi:MAG TPA: DUF6186 family protein [Mycobacteriales bacterium]|jgi:hypothetical protein|nr:DUF6186 family protein [Mycobacteriales bacterium]